MILPHTDSQRFTATLRVRVTPEEKARLQENADVAGLSASELVRRQTLGKPIVPQVDLAMIRELRRIGGLLKHIHNQSNGVYSKETAQALVAITTYIEQLSRDRRKGERPLES